MEIKKTKRRTTTTKKKAEPAEPDTNSLAENVAPTTELANVTGRLKKPLPTRARAIPKPKNSKQPDAPTSSSIGRRPKQSVVGQAKVAKSERDGQPQASASCNLSSQSLELPPPIASLVAQATETLQPFARGEASEIGAKPQVQVFPNRAGVEMAALRASTSSMVHYAQPQGHAVSTSHKGKFGTPVSLQASTSSAVSNHVSSSTTDAQLFEFITWPQETVAFTPDKQARQEVSPSQCSTPLFHDYGATHDTNPSQLQSSAIHPSKPEIIEDQLEWDRDSQDSKTTSAIASASGILVGLQKTPDRKMVDDAGDKHPLPHRITPLAIALTNVKISEDAKQEETSPSPDTPVTGAVIFPAETISAGPTPAPTPAFLEEGQTPDASTSVGYDSDATDITVSTLVASHAPTPKVKFQGLKATQRTSRPRTAEPNVDDQPLSRRLTIKLPAQPLAHACARSAPPIAETVAQAQSQPPVASKSQVTTRSPRTPHLTVQIPADPSSSRAERSDATTGIENSDLSPLSAVGAITFTPEPEPRFGKKRKLGRAT